MTDAGARAELGRAARWRALARRAARLERILYASIGRAIARRPAVPPGAKGFGFHKAVVPLLIVFIALNVLELGVLDLVLRRWLPARIVVDGLDAWGLVWMIGFLCAFLVRPHTVGEDGIRIRNGLDLEVHVAWANVRALTRARDLVGTKTPRVREVDGIRELALRSQGETNLRIDLIAPVSVSLPGAAPGDVDSSIDRIRLWADDPDAFLQTAHGYLAGAGRRDNLSTRDAPG